MRQTRALRAEGMVSRQGVDEIACLVTNGLDREQFARLACKLTGPGRRVNARPDASAATT
jgi:hypothetical protein